MSPSPSQLSEAGFFFIGPRDKVQCFSCETSHKNWKPAEVIYGLKEKFLAL